MATNTTRSTPPQFNMPTMDTQKVHATTGSTLSNMAKSAGDKTTPCCHVSKRPLSEYMNSPPGAPRPKRVMLPEDRQKTDPPSPTPYGRRRNNRHRHIAAKTKLIHHEFKNVAPSYHNVNKNYVNSIGEVHNQNDETKANGAMTDMQLHGTSKKTSTVIVQQKDHITSENTNVLDCEELFCQVNKAERDEEASFW